jgi:predicted N-acetyltransferase YhbS
MRIRPARQDDLRTIMAWARDEGWNPGVGDDRLFLPADPGGFLVAERDGRMVGSISMVRHGPRYAFCGLFIVRPVLRGGATGARLALAALELAGDRVVGTDGVLEHADDYARLGFVRAHSHHRYSGVVTGAADPAVLDVADVDVDQLLTLDDQCFPGDRREFMRAWLAPPHVTRVSVDASGVPDGFGVAREAVDGWRVGPLIAPDGRRAEAVVRSLAAEVPGQVLHVDINTGNPAAVDMAQRMGLEPGFACVRMYNGGIPDLPLHRMFAAGTLELG